MPNYSFTEQMTADYVEHYLENSKKIHYTELTEKSKIETILYKDLPEREVSGYPFASDYVDQDGHVYSVKEFDALSQSEQSKLELRFHYLPKYHELYVGTTGSGKTTGCMEPQLRAISSQKNKPNLFITDPKGELFEHNAKHLKANGYRLFVLNFRDFGRSDKWNPLLEMYEKKMSVASIGKGAKYCMGKVPENLMLYGKPEDFDRDGYISYNGRAFPDGEAYDRYTQFERDVIDSEVSALVNEFATQAVVIQSKTDRSWEQGAQNLLKGMLLCMLDEAAVPENGFTKDMMTLKTLQDFYLRLRHDFVDGEDRESISHYKMFRNKPNQITRLMSTALENAPNTSRSYVGVYEGHMNKWNLGHIYALTTGCTIDIDGDDDSPFAIFISTRDYDKSDYNIAGLFINWVYRKMLLKAENSIRDGDNVPTTRAMHFMLDEFCNIPAIADFENKIATARSRNIWFHLFVQSYEQLDLVYSHDTASVIRDNCNMQVFLGSQSIKTKQQFSSECGKTWVPSLASRFNPNDKSMTEVSVVPVSDLDLIEEGQIYIKRLYSPVIVSQFVRSYKCAKQGAFKMFRDRDSFQLLAPINDVSFSDQAHTYGKFVKDDREEFGF